MSSDNDVRSFVLDHRHHSSHYKGIGWNSITPEDADPLPHNPMLVLGIGHSGLDSSGASPEHPTLLAVFFYESYKAVYALLNICASSGGT